jgi:hypothetical protein
MKYFTVVFSFLFVMNLSIQQALMAESVSNHVVSPEQLQARLSSQSAQRMENIQEIQKLLNHRLVEQKVGRLVDLQRVKVAVPTLDDETLKWLADESRRANDDLRGGIGTVWIIVIAAVVAFFAWAAIARPGESS